MVFNPMWLIGIGALLTGIGGLKGAETQRKAAKEAELTPEQKEYEATLYRLKQQKLEEQGLMPTFVSMPRLVPAQRQILSALMGPVAGFPQARGVPTGISEMPVQRLPGRGPQAGLGGMTQEPAWRQRVGGLAPGVGIPSWSDVMSQVQQSRGQQGMGQGMGTAGPTKMPPEMLPGVMPPPKDAMMQDPAAMRRTQLLQQLKKLLSDQADLVSNL